jgi:hypothetical protein
MKALRASGRVRHLGLVFAFVLSVGLTACGTSEAPPETSQAPPPDEGASRRLSVDFTLLRTPPDGLPPGVRQTLKVPVSGMSWNLARRIPVSLPGAYWLVPGTEDLCIVATTPGSPAVGTVCASIGQALRHGIANTSLDPDSGRRTIVGVAPKGTRAVLVRSGPSTTSVHVRDGSFVLRDSVASPPDRLTLR